MQNTTARNSSLDYLLALATLGVIGYLFYPTLKDIAMICWNDDDYSHGLLLPIVAVYMIWDRKDVIFKKIKDSIRQDSKGGLILPSILLVLGLLVYFIGTTSGISYATWIAFFPVAIAAAYLILGKTAAFQFAPAILILFMAKPLPDSLVVRIFWPLQVMAAKVSTAVLEVLSVPVYLSGNIIEIPSMRLMVEEACSGMRSVIALLTLAFIVNYFIDLNKFSKVVLVLSSLGVAIAMNVFRVALTGVLAHFYDPESATGFFHTFSGMIVFIVGLPILYLIGMGLLKLEGKSS